MIDVFHFNGALKALLPSLDSKPFKAFLLSIKGKSIGEQHEQLKNFFNDWKRGFEQIDDVCVMGVRV